MSQTSSGSSQPDRPIRDRAKELLRTDAKNLPDVSTADLQSLLEELQVYQSELDSQNQNLREMQLQLADSRDRYSDLFEFAPVGYVTLDLQGHILEANLIISDMLGVPRKELLGKRFSAFVEDNSQDAFYHHKRDSFRGQCTQSCEIELRRDNGSQLSVRLESIASGAGEARQLRMALIDITDRLSAEHALRESENKYRTLFESLDEGFCIIELIFDDADEWAIDYRFLETNPAFATQTGIDNAVGRRMRDIAPDHESHWFEIYGRVAKTGESVRFRRPASSLERYYDVFCFRIGEPAQRRVAILFEDISEQLEGEDKLRQLTTELSEASRQKDQFLAMLAHELRNPLAPLRSGLDILAMDSGKHRDTVSIMQQQLDHLVRLVDDLLDVSRIVRGRIELRKEPVELSTILKRASDAIKPLVDDRQQAFIKSLPEQAVWLDADPVRLVQVVENLLNNASKYTDARGRIELSAELRDGHAIVSVSDTGIGIEPDFQPYVFQIFTQCSPSLERAQGGLGIGLTLVERLVELHSGVVSVESEGTGRGTTFTVRIPVIEGPEEVDLPEELPQPDCNHRILIVDDNSGAVFLLSKLLKKLGDHDVQNAFDGPSAVELIKRFRPEIVFLDIGLPGMDGFQVARTIRQDRDFDSILLVALTGYGQEGDKLKSQAAGFDEHLVKPPSLKQIKQILQHVKLPSKV